MMQLVYFSQKDQFLAHIQALEGSKLYVTPSPAKADNLRSQLADLVSQDVITIAKFTSDLLNLLWHEEHRPVIKRKAELFLIFGILKNNYFPQLGFEQFLQAYNLFSDLRSFTLDEDALAAVLEEQHEEIKKSVSLFWQLLELTGYVDEHGAYHRIAEKLRSAEEEADLKKTFIFWGFQHLNGQQIDLLKALAIRYQVIIPFPEAMKDHLKRSDWISWLQDYKVKEVVLPKITTAPKASWISLNSREIAYYLKHLEQPDLQLVLGVSKLEARHIQSIPFNNIGFKVPHQFLQHELAEIATDLENELPDGASIQEFLQYLDQKKAEVLSNSSRRSLPFKRLKVLQLYQEAAATIQEMTDQLVSIDTFFKKLLKEVVSLNQPRTSFVPLRKDKINFELKDMSSLEDVNRQKPVILCIDERFEDIQGLGQNYTEEIQKKLSSLGPLKRNELELRFKQWEFHDLFSQANVVVLMPETLLKHSLVWKRLFQGITLTEKGLTKLQVERSLLDVLAQDERKSYQGNFSASRLQTYIDCPRKFYYSFVENINPSIKLEMDIDPKVSGTLVHKIIEDFFERSLTVNELPQLTREVLEHYIHNHSLKLSNEVYQQRELVFNQRALNGISFLASLEESIGKKINWKIEQSFSQETHFKLSGKIDCVGESDDSIFLLDFKSSESAASSNAEVEDMSSIQLWIYALASQRLIPDFLQKKIIVGYVVLDDPSRSNLLMNSEEYYSTLKTLKICRPKLMEADFKEALLEAQEKIDRLVDLIRSDKQFSSIPRKAQSCFFCELSPVCVKSEISHV